MSNITKIQSKGELGANLIDIPIVHNLYETYALLHQVVLKFPKAQRYSLGEQCNSYLLDTMEAILVSAASSHKETKASYMHQASVKLDVFKILIRLAKDCDCLSNNHYLQITGKTHQIGKMLGGWIKSVK